MPSCLPEQLNAWLEANLTRLDEPTREKAAANPLRVFDNIDAKPDGVQAALGEAPTIGDSLCEACRAHFAVVREHLDATGVRYELRQTLVRGLDYYTRTTWEFRGPEEGAQSTLSGGGRYDGLIEEIGGPPAGGVGFGAGIERLLIALEHAGVTAEQPGIDVFFVLEDGAAARRGRALARRASLTWNRRGHGLRRTVGQGAAHPGRPARRPDHGRRQARRRRPPDGEQAGRGRAALRDRRQALSMSAWRDLMCGAPRSGDVGQDAHARRLGGAAP